MGDRFILLVIDTCVVVCIVELDAVAREVAWSFVVLVALILPTDKHLGRL